MKAILRSTLLITSALSLAPLLVNPTALAATKAPKLTWKGTIDFFAQSYTPAAPGVKLQPGAIQYHELEKLAVQFEHMYPGIKIHFVNPSFSDSNQAVETLAAAGKMYDVYWQQYDNWNTVFPQGIVYDLKPYMNQPNPFIPGNKAWKDVMNPHILAASAAPGGQEYGVNGDYLGVEFFYNKNLFKKAGIKAPPKTWKQLILDAATLRKHGITPGADIPVYDWWVRDFLGNYLGLPTLKKIASFSNQPGDTEFDDAIAYYKGILDPSKNPRIMAWWPVVKQLYSYWDNNVTVLPWNNTPSNAETGSKLFAAGKVAMVFQGSWLPNSVKGQNNGKIPFGIGSFPMPSLMGTSKYATSYNSSGDAGGPQAAFQFGISTPRADQSMSQPGKLEACLDWLRFISTPQHDQAIVNEVGSFVPTFKGTTPVPDLASVEAQLQAPWYQEDGGQFLTSQEYTTIRNIFQEYVSGNLSLASATQQYGQAVSTAFHQFVLTQHINLSKY